MSWVLWTVVGLLLVVLVSLQFVGVRALESWGVRPSGAVLTLRVLNVLAAVAIVAIAFWKWVS